MRRTRFRARLRRAFPAATASLAAVALLGAGCDSDSGPSTPPADAISLGPTSTLVSPDDPPVAIGGAAGADGHRAVRFNPAAWERVATSYVDDDPADPYYELHTEGHDHFWFGVELHPDVGPGWTGELGLFATDCEGAGVCVRFDPDGGAGPIGPILSQPDGEVQIEQLEQGLAMTFRHLVFVRSDGVSYRVDEVRVDTT